MTREKLELLLKNLELSSEYMEAIPSQSELAKYKPTKKEVKK